MINTGTSKATLCQQDEPNNESIDIITCWTPLSTVSSTTFQCRDTHKAEHMHSLFAKLYLSSVVVMLAAIVRVAIAAPGPDAGCMCYICACEILPKRCCCSCR
ncbi:hypothetical protein SCLCIDRAFT_921611 [Scleroderma citrinum Foug A]|uniref:Uncharacterized protein n=1 Tax=Scleroderma citrinum Foug A TaxID=1036808 RepID=A0A0C3DYW8_9AGAM|nr:hypothetical protein SCLCIDRAFT_921611 [Scleroderma citrinum Foug A]